MHSFEEIWEKITLWWHRGESQGKVDASDKQMRETLEEWFLVRKSMLSDREYVIDMDKAWRNMENRIAAKRGLKYYLSSFRMVAILVLCIGLTVFSIHYFTQKDSLIVADNFTSASHKAELVLANGKTIYLDDLSEADIDMASGLHFENDFQHGELSYRLSAGGDSAAVAATGRMEYHTLNIPKGGDYSILLPDGTRVWLNSETKFRFPIQFSQHSREVWLDGEAYFKVARNEKSAFTVHLPTGSVEVLGTSFNVSAYQTDAKWHAVLVKGQVRVHGVNGGITLKPSDMYVEDKVKGTVTLEQVDPELYTSWVDGKFHFNAFPFEELVKKLERWYDFDMVYEDEDIRHMHFTGTINKHRPMDELLFFLEKTTDIRFKLEGRKITVYKIEKN